MPHQRIRRITRFLRCGLRGNLVRGFSTTLHPGWQTPKTTQRWGPEIPDNLYYWEHPTYTGFLLWIRGARPYIEKLFGNTWKTVQHVVCSYVLIPSKILFVRHNPDARLQVVSIVSFYFTVQSINMALNRAYQHLIDIKKCRSVETAQELQDAGFWATRNEDVAQRVDNFNKERRRLNSLWTTALADATRYPDATEGFKRLCSYLESPPDQDAVPSLATWRFDMIPYGAHNPHTTTFPVTHHEQPHRAFAFNLTSNNLAYDWGDYINRLDNKQALIRPSRMLFTDVYLPPTK